MFNFHICHTKNGLGTGHSATQCNIALHIHTEARTGLSLYITIKCSNTNTILTKLRFVSDLYNDFCCC